MAKQNEFFERVAQTIIDKLKEGTAPWQKGWDGGVYGSKPINPTTSKRYRGGNALFLMMQGYDDPRWMTYRQAATQDAQVKKGEHGTPIVYWKFEEEHPVKDEQGKPIKDEDGKTRMKKVQLERPRAFLSYVFNAQQIEGLPPLVQNTDNQWNISERAETILANSGAKIEHKEQGKAFYRPTTDTITLPVKGQFFSDEKYYSTALHELGHWTGHESRLNRDLAHPFNSEGYAREELRAEIASFMLGQELGSYTPDTDQHVAYVASWIKALEEDPREIFRAAAEAEKILDYVMAFELKQEQQVTQDTIRAEKVEAKDPLAESQGAVREPSELTLAHEVGVSAMQHAHQGLMQSEDWAKAKSGDKSAAQKIVDTHWNEGETEALRKRLKLDKPIAFVTVPSSTDTNQVPMMLAHKLAVEMGGEVVDGGDLFRPADDRAMKDIQKNERIFIGREYVPRTETFASLRDKQIVLVEDVLTTGSSAYATVRALQRQDIAVQTVAGLMGDARLTSEPQLVSAFQKVLKQAGVTIKAKDMANVLSRGEIKTIIELVHKTQNKEEAHELAQRIHGIFYKRTDRCLGQDSWGQSRGDRTGENTGHAGSLTGLQAIPADMEDGRGSEAGRKNAGRNQDSAKKRIYLSVSYFEREVAKEAGAKWDSVARSWYVGDNADIQKLSQWLPSQQSEQAPAMLPREEFAEVLRTLGCKVEGEHPIMDGHTHRIPTEGDSRGALSGFYVAHQDGHPAGYAKNNRSGEETRWKSQGAVLSTKEKAILAAECVKNREERVQQLAQKQEKAALRVLYQLGDMQQASQKTPYQETKGLALQKGVFVGTDGKTTCLPAQDAHGKIWTMQYIQEDGTKRFAKDARKEGCFHCVGGMDALAKTPVLVISEGYATASTLATALGHGVIAAFDAGNLGAVAKALHEKYPEKPIVIAGDDDRHLMASSIGKNPGREKAELAAQSVGGVAVFPIFATDEKGREFKDFNDLTKSKLGSDAVARQVRPAIEKAIRQHKASLAQDQQQTHKISR